MENSERCEIHMETSVLSMALNVADEDYSLRTRRTRSKTDFILL